MEQRLDRLLQVEPRGLPLPEGDIVHGAAITQDAYSVDDKYLWSCDRLVEVCDYMLRVDQNLWNAPRPGSLLQDLNRFILVRGNRQQFHLPIPFLEHIYKIMISPL